MGVRLFFTSVGPVDPDIAAAIRCDLQRPADEQPWVLCEPPHFGPTGADGRLRGSSKLNLHPWADEWESASRVPVERNDLQELLHRLVSWSGQHGITWELTVDGTPLGRIADGVCPAGLEATLESFADVGQFLAEEFPQEFPPQGTGGQPGQPGPRLWQEPE
jgi:hypothetical protein